jgi:hypothetical protein
MALGILVSDSPKIRHQGFNFGLMGMIGFECVYPAWNEQIEDKGLIWAHKQFGFCDLVWRARIFNPKKRIRTEGNRPLFFKFLFRFVCFCVNQVYGAHPVQFCLPFWKVKGPFSKFLVSSHFPTFLEREPPFCLSRHDCAWIRDPMKKSERSFTIEIRPEGSTKGSALLGIDEGSTLTISLGSGKQYSASIEKVHQALARWHAKEHPTGRKQRRLFTSSEEYRKYRREHPEEFQS